MAMCFCNESYRSSEEAEVIFSWAEQKRRKNEKR
jgi:hypothetical protein